MNPIPAIAEPLDLKSIMAAVGPALKVQYNKPHCYAVAAPSFAHHPRLQRELPSDPFSVYVHIPFCNYRCSFCTYATRQGSQRSQMQRYVRAVQTELQFVEPGSQLTELYVGGGTPTVLPAELLAEVLGTISDRTNFLSNAIRTVECSPDSLTPQHLDVIRQFEINRASMGMQTLDDAVLTQLKRRHDGLAALAACEMLVASDLAVNIDLIYGLPGQTEASFARDFRAVAESGVHCVTVYNLRINEKTPVAGVLRDEEQLDTQRLIRWRLLIRQIAAEQGFTQTRWHTFVRQSPQCTTHQLAPGLEDTRNAGSELGIGQSARSRLGTRVFRNHTRFHEYLKRIEAGESPVEDVNEFGRQEQKTAFVSSSLGDGRPLDRLEYERRFGGPVEQDFDAVLKQLARYNLINETPREITLTPNGRLVFDLVTWMFYPQKARDWIADRQEIRLPRSKSGPPKTDRSVTVETQNR